MFDTFERIGFYAFAGILLFLGANFSMSGDLPAGFAFALGSVSVLVFYWAIQQKHSPIFRFFICIGWATFHFVAITSTLADAPNSHTVILFSLLGLLMPVLGLLFRSRKSKSPTNLVLLS